MKISTAMETGVTNNKMFLTTRLSLRKDFNRRRKAAFLKLRFYVLPFKEYPKLTNKCGFSKAPNPKKTREIKG
jgi:hypothetical protein